MRIGTSAMQMKTVRLCTFFFYYPVPYPQVCEFSELQNFFHTVLLLMVYFLARKSFPGSCLSCRPSLLISFGLSLWLLAAGLHCSNIFISCTRLEQTNTLTTVFSNYINFIHWCLYFLPFQFRSVMWNWPYFCAYYDALNPLFLPTWCSLQKKTSQADSSNGNKRIVLFCWRIPESHKKPSKFWTGGHFSKCPPGR